MVDDQSERDRARSTRARLRAARAGARGEGGRPVWAGEPAAIYCRISHLKDEDQTGVERQEEICKEVAARLGLVVSPEHVLKDPNRSAWKRDRKRPGWDQLLTLARGKKIRHVIAYHPDRLMRQPKDLEELLGIADDADITLHGQANRRDLADPDDRFFLRIEVAHACRSSDDTSRRMKDKQLEDASEGKPKNGGRRTYGYDKTGWHIVDEEAEIIREVFALYLAGRSPHWIAEHLAAAGKTRDGNPWTARTVRDVLTNPSLAAIRMFHGQNIGQGRWPAIIDLGIWTETQERLTFRAVAAPSDGQERTFYLLRGLLMCSRCSVRMSGTGKGRYYICSRHQRTTTDARRCVRKIDARELEDFVSDAAIGLLEKIDITGATATVSGLPAPVQEAVDADQLELDELYDAWKSQEINSREYREMRKVVTDRIRAAKRRVTIARPAVEVLEGMTGPNARANWTRMRASGDRERLNAVLRFLFGAVVIGPSTTPIGTFDYSRITFDKNEL
jgi:DNA invertase Pin-like site-specific DNA recombinase